jgi:omega-amidase
MTKIIASLAQMHLILGQPETNLENAAGFIASAAKESSNMVLLPELWSTSYDLKKAKIHAEQNVSIVAQLAFLAKENHINIGGSLLEQNDGHLFNTYYLFSATGQLLARYRKIHLFRLMDEDKWLQAGDALQIIPFQWGQTGLAICYDLRFPELFRKYALENAILMTLCAEWPIQRINHWKILLQARAIENQMFFAGVNSVGMTGDTTYGGNSAIINPWGEVLVQGNDHDEQLLTAEIDLDQVSQCRQKIPVFQDRRPELY